MKQNLTRKGGTALLSLAMLLSADMANAAVIEHGADRYIINVEEMDLNGEETVLDLLMMLPDVMTVDGKTVIGDDDNNRMQKRLFGQYAVRVDNMNIQMNAEAFVKNTKAKEIKCIKVCTNPGVQKGCGTLKQVIDIYYRSNEKGNEGRVAVEGDTYGQGGVFATDWKTGDNYSLHLYGVGDLENRKYVDEDYKQHALKENVRAHFNWDITDKDNMIITAAQTYNREKIVGVDGASYSRSFNFDDCYTRDLGNGAYAMFQAGVDYNHENMAGVRVMSTNPYGVIELGAPFISNNLYINGGVESGYSGETVETIGVSDVTSRSRYEDFYGQLDWTCGKFHLSVGDRVRFTTNYFSNEFKNNIFNHTATSNHFTASTWLNINEHNTVQATFARRFDGPDMMPVFLMTGDAWNGYVKDVFESPIYTTELRYTYQKQDFNIMGIVKNLHKNFEASDVDHENILQTGVTAYMHKGVLRITAGVTYNWQKTSYAAGETKYNNFVNLKLAPQVSLVDGWRLTSTMLYNSRKAYDSEYYTPANFYADFGVSKEINKNWLVEAKYHDLAGQHTGNRAATVGFTYYWGK